MSPGRPRTFNEYRAKFLWDLGSGDTPYIDGLGFGGHSIGFDVPEEQEFTIVYIMSYEKSGGLVNPRSVAAMVDRDGSNGYIWVYFLVLAVDRKPGEDFSEFPERQSIHLTHVEYNNLWFSSSSLQEAKLGHIRSEKTHSKSLSVCLVAYMRFLTPPREPADITRPLTWSKCECVMRKQLHVHA